MIIIILLFIFIVLYFIYNQKQDKIDNYFSLKEPVKEEKELLNNFFLQKGKNILYWPIKKLEIEKELIESYKINYAYYYGFLGMDSLASKRGFYLFLSEQNQNIIPLTIDFYDFYYNKEKRTKFESQIKKDDLFILKKEIQRQEGLKIVSTYSQAIESLQNENYVLIQKMLTNPFLIADKIDDKTIINRKINLRIYFLVIINKDKLYTYIYKDGFLYYTPQEFKICKDITNDNIITSGYISRDVYQRNPLTIEDLRKYINDENIWNNFWKKLKFSFYKISQVYKPSLLSQNKNKNCFHIFGADIEPEQNLQNLKILELNKFPDLSAKDERDKQLKTNMFNNTLRLIQLKDFNLSKIDNFERIY